MGDLLSGYVAVAAIIACGYLIARLRLLGPDAGTGLARLAFFVLTPCLVFSVLIRTPIERVFSAVLPVAAISAGVVATIFVLVGVLGWRRPIPDVTVGAMSTAYVNAANIGLPLSVYVLDDPAASISVVLLQILVISPIAITILELTVRSGLSLRRMILLPARNPLLIASVLGLVASLTGFQPPAVVMQPVHLVADAAVPLVLMAFGMSLRGGAPLAPGDRRRDVILAVALKALVMPAIAWTAGTWIFGLEGHALFVVVALAALPTAQNIFIYARLYDRGVAVARDTILLTTLLSVPALLLVTAMLGGR